MKTAAKICIVLACLAIMAAGAYLLTSHLGVSFEITYQSAGEATERFNEISLAVRNGEYGNVSALADVSEYNFVTVRAEINSYSPFKAEWINLSVDASEGDVIVLSSNAWTKEMDAFGAMKGEDAMYITMLARVNQTEFDAKLEYYVFGRYHEADETLNISAQGR